jgi:glycosyltransferase involved in cell wall biosynthesis
MSAILEVCEYSAPYPGNFVPSVLALGDAVRSRLGLDYQLVFSAFSRDAPWIDVIRERGFEPRFLPEQRSIVRDARALAPIATAAGAAVIQTHFTRFDLPAGLVGRRVGARVIWTSHLGDFSYSGRQDLQRAIKGRFLSRVLCDRVIAVSDEIRRQSIEQGYRPDRVSVVFNGIDLSRFDQIPDREQARAELGLRPDERVVLGFCWEPIRKGADLLIEACGQAGATALIVGADEFRASHPTVPDHVRVIEPVSDPGRLFAAADVFASASRAEAFPYAIGEAMASRLLVASSDIPEAKAYFDAPGIQTFPNGEAAGLAAALRTLLDSESKDDLGEANRAYVIDRIGLERHVEATLAVIEAELVHARRSG